MALIQRCACIPEVAHGVVSIRRQVALIQRRACIPEVAHGVVSIDRWPLYRGVLVYLKWPME